MTAAGERLIEDARRLRATRAAAMLSGYLGCQVTPCADRPGTVEARGLPGSYALVGSPADVLAEGRRLLMAQWLEALLARRGRP